MSDLQGLAIGDVAPAGSVPHPLDGLIWRALTGAQRSLAEGDDRARRYPVAIAPFAATADLEPASLAALLPLIGPEEDHIALVTLEEVVLPPAFAVARRDRVDQMILADDSAPGLRAAAPFTELGAADVPDMLALAQATRPGPFASRTIELGRYLGVRDGGALVAMAGERLRMDGFTEVSAVCVDAAHRGRGLAAGLIGPLVASILARAETPILHVFSTNRGAIALYEKLGFVLRRRLHLTVIGRAPGHAPAPPAAS